MNFFFNLIITVEKQTRWTSVNIYEITADMKKKIENKKMRIVSVFLSITFKWKI